VVTICTNRFNIHNSTFYPRSVFTYVFCVDLRTVIISIYSVNLLVFVTERKCVYCAVRTGYLNVIQVRPRQGRLNILQLAITLNTTTRTTPTVKAWHLIQKFLLLVPLIWAALAAALADSMVAIGSGEFGDERLCVGVPGRLWLLLWPFTENTDCCCGGGICWSRAMGVLSTAIVAGSGDGEFESQLSCNIKRHTKLLLV